MNFFRVRALLIGGLFLFHKSIRREAQGSKMELPLYWQ